MSMTTKQAANSKPTMMMLSIRRWSSGPDAIRPEWSSLCTLAGILLSVIHSFFKLFCFLLIHERQARKAVLELERVEERSILVVCESLVNFLIPDDPPV
jgi:hypothetical protein